MIEPLLLVLKNIKDFKQGKARFLKLRSPLWRQVRRKYLEKHPMCSMCGSNYKVEVHHIVPFHVDKTLELEESNLITLCESKKHGINCHLFIGHRGNYSGHNPTVIEDSFFLGEHFLNEPNS